MRSSSASVNGSIELSSGYTATFAGTWQYEPSSTDALLNRVDVGG